MSSLRDDSHDKMCPICRYDIDNKKTLDKCGHSFCRACIEQCFAKMTPRCPVCQTVYGTVVGSQPDNGVMAVTTTGGRLPGYEKYGTIVITYSFPNGTQSHKNPKPGRPFRGTTRVAYLPDSSEGRRVCGLLRRAFDQRVTFTVGRSATTGMDDVVTWNDIHHKTNTHGGSTSFGYPDPTYLSRVQQELAAWGIK